MQNALSQQSPGPANAPTDAPPPAATSAGQNAVAGAAPAQKSAVKPMMTQAELLASSKPSDWRQPDPERTLIMSLATGKIVIELSPEFAPRHVANILKLARAHWYDGLAVVRVQDNFVAQWGDPLNSHPEVGEKRLPAEFSRSLGDLPFERLHDPDTYAPQVGFSGGTPVGRTGDDSEAEVWPLHCYGAVGVGRDNDPATAIGTELYAVIGQAPRQLDRNTALVGRVIYGMELLSSLARGSGDHGFYEHPEQREPIRSVRVAADLPPAERLSLDELRTDTKLFQKLVELRRNRRDAWYKVPAGHIDVCNVSIPVREHVADHAEHADHPDHPDSRRKR
jgi:peptidylprolyl isomerase